MPMPPKAVRLSRSSPRTGLDGLFVNVIKPKGFGVPEILTAALSDLTETQEGVSIQLDATGGKPPLTWDLDITSDALPTGLTLSSEGLISGDVDAATADTYDLVFKLTDSNDPAAIVTREITLVVNAAPEITTVSLDGGTENTAYSDTLTATGGTGALAWTVDEGTTDELPAGLSLSSAGVISGTPSEGTAATYAVTFRVTDANGVYATAELELVVADDVVPLAITNTSPLTAVTYSEAITPIQMAATGGSGTKVWTVQSGALIAGLSMDGAGEITGTPSEEVTNKAVTIRVTDDSGHVDKAFTQTSALPSALSGAIRILRAAAYDEDTGIWPSDISPSTLLFEQGTELSRPAEGSDAQGASVDFAGAQVVIANAAVRGLQVGLNAMSGIWICEGFTDNAQYVEASASSAQSGLNCNAHTTGAGSTRLFAYLTGTFYQATNAGIPATTTKACGLTITRNTANQPVGYVGSTTYTGSNTIKNEAFGATNHIAIGGAWDGSSLTFALSGKVRTIVIFNKALSAAEMQAAQEYLQNKSFFGTAGVTLWA